MTEEQKKALIKDCQDEISKLERAIRNVNSYAKPAYRDEFISEYQSQLKRQQIALAALTAPQPVAMTAQPIKLPKQTSYRSPDGEKYELYHKEDMINAIRAAGYQVEG